LKTKTKTTTRITEITVERDEFLVIKRVGRRFVWCSECGRETQTMTLEEAMTFAGVSRAIFPVWVRTGGIHLTETAEGRLSICVNSLRRQNP